MFLLSLLLSTIVWTTALANPLVLNRYLNDSETAKNKSLVDGSCFVETDNTVSYSALFSLTELCQDRCFVHFWFFPSKNANKYAPLILWVGGDPKTSALAVSFTETGPYKIHMNGTITAREFPWNDERHVLYMDRVGVGFSSTSTPKSYPLSEPLAVAEIYEALTYFYMIFHEYKKNELYVWGENSGARLALGTAYAIHLNNKAKNFNLKGVALGNAFLDPVNMIDYSVELYNRGFLNAFQKKDCQRKEREIRRKLEKFQHLNAYAALKSLLRLMRLVTGIKHFENIFASPTASLNVITEALLNKSESFHVSKNFNMGEAQFNRAELMISVRKWLEILLDADEQYAVLLFSGNHNLLAGYNANTRLMEKLSWKHMKDYQTARRVLKEKNGTLVGFTQTGGNVKNVMVYNGGLFTVNDQPAFMYDIMKLFTSMGAVEYI